MNSFVLPNAEMCRWKEGRKRLSSHPVWLHAFEFKLFEIPLGAGKSGLGFSPLHGACSNVDVALLLLLRPSMAVPPEARQRWVKF